jgi:hypothetical protein
VSWRDNVLSRARALGATREAVAPVPTQIQFCRKSNVKQESRHVLWRDYVLSRAKTPGATREAVAPGKTTIQYRRSSMSREGSLVNSLSLGLF